MMSLPLCRASSKMSIMPNGATQRSDTKVLLSLKRNTPGRSPFERRHVCPSQRVHSSPAIFDRQIAAHDIAGFAQALVEGAQTAYPPVRRCAAEKPAHRDGRLLPACRERPGDDRTAEQRD